jgi:hypothetical protein
MMKRTFLLQALVMVLILALLCLTGCHKDTEEDKIKNIIAEVQKAAGEKDTRTVLGHLSKTYQDPQGNNYDGIKGLLFFYFMKHRRVNVYVPDIECSIENSAARASFQAVLTGAGEGAVLPEALGVYAFTVVLRKESGAWKITSAAWERIGEGTAPKE